jgi:two-component system, OmpR family, response regulator
MNEHRALVVMRDCAELDTRVVLSRSLGASDNSPSDDKEHMSRALLPARILVLDKDPMVRNTVSCDLASYGFTATVAHDLQGVMRQVAAARPDLILLDLKLGQCQNFNLLREIRSRLKIRVIVTSSADCSEADRVAGLELGADDHITKPFGTRELVARIRAILRRRGGAPAQPQRAAALDQFWFGGWHLDRSLRQLTSPDGQLVALTRGEYTLLTVFTDAPRRPLSRAQILQATRIHEDVFNRSIDAQVLRLRRKLEVGSNPPVIRAVRGFGYVFDLSVTQHNPAVGLCELLEAPKRAMR